MTEHDRIELAHARATLQQHEHAIREEAANLHSSGLAYGDGLVFDAFQLVLEAVESLIETEEP